MKNFSTHCLLSPSQVSRLENKILVNGQLEKPHASKAFAVVHSATQMEVCKQIDCDEQDVSRTVNSAAMAQKEWAALSARQRGLALRKALPKLNDAQIELAQLLTLETSKAISTESQADLRAAVDILDFYSGLGSEIKGETVPFRPGVLTYSVREPLGVVGAIIPWNVPLLLMALKIAPALVAGNSVVVKTSEFAPLAALRFAEILASELPPGVLNVLSGHGSTGELLIAHPLIKKISFTGSVATGTKVYQQAAGKLIPVTLELGGKSPMIVCGDAKIDAVVDGAIQGMRFTRQGQSCSAASRIFVHSSLYNEFIEKISSKLNALVIGDPFDPKTQVGAVACQMQYDKIQKYLKMIEPSQKIELNSLPSKAGLFLRPTLLVNLEENHPAIQEEIFGPVACIIRWENNEEVIQRANKTHFGLAATVWTESLRSAMKMTQELDAGLVQVNQNLVVQAGLEYGGFKSSGLGKEASLEAMVHHYTRSKTIMING